MFSSNSIKIVFILISLLTQACGFWQSKTDANTSATPFVVEGIKSDVPFSNKEPDVYQTEISVMASGVEDVTFTARNGANRLTLFDFQKKTEFAVLRTAENRIFQINHRRKVYAENESSLNVSDATGDSLKNSLTAEWLNQKKDAKFENLGAENNQTKYRITFSDAANSEIVISVDEKINLPIKQEFFSLSGGGKTLMLTMELKNFSLQTEAKLFEVPKDYRKISPKEFQEILRRER